MVTLCPQKAIMTELSLRYFTEDFDSRKQAFSKETVTVGKALTYFVYFFEAWVRD